MRAATVFLAAGAIVLAGCATDAREPGVAAPSTSAAPTSTDSTTSTPPLATSPTPEISTGSPTPTTALLAWEPTGRPAEETVTTGGGWTIVVDQERSLATIDGPSPLTVAGSKRFRIGDALLDTGWAVVVRTDSLEERPAVATVVDLTSGAKTTIDGRSEVPTTTGGTWALQGSTLVHATTGPGGAYCLARRDLATGTAETVWCAAKRTGFTNARVTPAGLGVMGFDDQRPSCRTLGTVADGTLTPLPAVTACQGWEGVTTDAGVVWSEVPNENRLDEATIHARSGDTVVALGPATSDTLTWCAGATYVVRDPQAGGEPARLLRWTEAGVFETVYESKGGGQAFLSAPRCGGDRITVTAYVEGGDEQVSAPLG